MSFKMSSRHIQLAVESEESLNKYETEVLDDDTEYSVNWRDIIFLPFDNLWELLIMLSVVVNVFVTIYDASYDFLNHFHHVVRIIYYTTDILYFMDTVLRLAHRNMPHYRALREHEPESIISLMIDIITLLPIYEVYLLLRSTSRIVVKTDHIRYVVRTKSLLRLYRVYEYFNRMVYYAGISQKLVVFIAHYLTLSLLIHLLGALWNTLGCLECQNNWTNNLKLHHFDKDNPTDWLVICYTVIGNTVAHNSRGNIRAERFIEAAIIITTMLSGYVAHFMIYFGQLTRAYIKSSRRQFKFVDNLKSIKHLLNDYGIDKKLQDKTIDYYNVFWEKRSGIKTMPPIFERLPAPLQKEVMVDIFWNALSHSHLFGKEDMSFKRALSLEMKSEFFLPGDYVYRLNKIKSQMVYIVSGILQVLTEEDEESPIISFSSGTILGEMACLLPTKSVANVRCATYCELHTLNIYSLYRVLKDYPGKSKLLLAKLQERIEITQKIHSCAGYRAHPVSNYFQLTEPDSSIKWIKLQWRKLAKSQYSSKKIGTTGIIADPSHCSIFLDLLVLSEEVELKMQVICLRGSCPFVLEPDSSFRHFTVYLILFSIIMQSILLPYNIAFKRRISRTLFSVCFVLDIIYFTDIYLKLSTAIKTRSHLISRTSDIIIQRMKEVSFLIDLVGSLPVDYITTAMGASLHISALLKLNRLLKIHQVFGFINARENTISVNSLTARLAKYLFIYVFLCYWYTCFVYALTCFHETCTYYGWLNYNDVLDEALGIPLLEEPDPWTSSLFYVMSTALSISLTARIQYTIIDMLSIHLLIIISYFLFSYCYAGLCATFVLRLEKQKTYQDYTNGMLKFLKDNKISGTLRGNVMKMLYFWWHYNQNAELFTEAGILKDATTELQDKIFKQRIRKCLLKVPLFSKFDNKLINFVVEKAKIKTLPEDTEVLNSEYRPTLMHIIVRGYCQMKSIMAGDFERDSITILKSGDAFPIIELLHQVTSLINVTTITTVELISIQHSDLVEIFLANPELRQEIEITTTAHFAAFEGPLLRKKGRLPEMIPAEHSLGPGDMFTYEIYDDDEIDPEEAAYIDPFKQLGKWSFLRYFFLRHTIDPHKKFFFCWEVFRCIFAITRLLLVFTYFNLLLRHRHITNWILNFLDVTATADFYVRLHCEYYNDKGIVVTHPLATSRHYLRTSFPVDLVGTLPFRLLKVDQMLGYEHRDLVYTIISLACRPLQLHRFTGFLNYLQSLHISKFLQALKYTVLVMTSIGSLTVIIQLLTCRVKLSEEDGAKVTISYNNGSWLLSTPFKDQLDDVVVIYVECLYAAVTAFTASTCGAFTIQNIRETNLILTVFVFGFIFRALFYAKIISNGIGGNVNLTIYQERVKSFMNFVKAEYVDEGLIADTIDHYRYLWKKTQGGDISKTLNKFHANLHEAVAYNLYGSTLEAVELFQGADNSFFRQLGVHLTVQHYKKDSEIIRCNDVQGLMFIVYKGKVDVTLAGTKACSLSQGGIFGCMERQGITRQTITVTAKVHVELLVIHSNQFHSIIGKFIQFTERLRQSNYFHSEYAESKKRVYFGMASNTSQLGNLSSNDSIRTNWVKRVCDKIRLVINPDDLWYRVWHYIIYVHVATISSLVFMIFIFMSEKNQETKLYVKILIYILDAIFIIKIYFGFHLSYVDFESGVTISDPALIRKKYLKSYKFWYDILACIPFELITMCFTKSPQIIRYSMGNRFLRLIYLVEYYNECRDKLSIKTHLRRTFLIYLICINIQIGACVWWLAACLDGACYYAKSTDRIGRHEFVKATAGRQSILLTYEYVINLFTMTGLEITRPLTITEVLVSVIIVLAFQYSAIALISEFATMLSVEQFTMSTYEYNTQKLRIYLKGCELSPAIVEKVWKYSSQLWQRQRGEWMPELLTKAPGYLMQDLKLALYGHHLHNHFLFGHTHVDFLRQLAVHMHRCVFFPGNYLAEKGDVDGSMYFIHSGTVEVYEKYGNNEMLRLMLKKDQSFAEAEGLYNIPHRYSYKARTVVDAVILRHNEWQYLMNWFPASNEEIHQRADENALKHVFQSYLNKLHTVPSDDILI